MQVVTLKHVSKGFGPVAVLQDVSFTVQEGERLGLVGANGVGKSTLLRLIAGQIEPDGGEIDFPRAVDTGYLPQETRVRPGQSVAALVHEAVGDQLTCVFVNHGLLREGEAEQVERDYVAATGVDLVVVDAVDQFLGALAGVTDPEEKRKIIGREFIRSFEQAARDIVASAGQHGEEVRFLVQGTLYPDVVESGGGEGTANIKSHHNVGGLPDDLQFELVEPLRTLFKDEVRLVGEQLGLPAEMVWRQPFPGPGLGIRIIGEVTADRLDILRRADAIARQELTRAGLDRDIWQMPVVLLADVRSVGVQGDGRTYGHPIVLRPVSSEDAMTADWTRLPYDVLSKISNRITNEVKDVNRVVLDVTSKPPGTIEWE